LISLQQRNLEIRTVITFVKCGWVGALAMLATNSWFDYDQ